MNGPAALRPGARWSTADSPHAREPMDMGTHPAVRRIILKMAAQASKSEIYINILGALTDIRPRPVLIVLPDETVAGKTYNNRLLYLFTGTPRLRRLMTGKRADESGLKINLTDESAAIDIVWPTPGQLSQWPKELVIIDEANKVEQAPGKTEANVIDLALERLKQFEDTSLALLGCTPTVAEARISVEFEQTDKRHTWVPCLNCGFYYIPDPLHVKTPKGVGYQAVHKHSLARYECPDCRYHLNNAERITGLQYVIWVPEAHTLRQPRLDIAACEAFADDTVGPEASREDRLRARAEYCETENRGEVEILPYMGYQASSLISPTVSLSRFAAEDLKTQSKGDKKRQNFVNSWCGRDWTESIQSINSKSARQLCEGRLEEHILPPETQHVITGADVQKDHFWHLSIAIGYEGQIDIVDAARAETWDELIALTVEAERLTETGESIPTDATMIDSAHRPDEVLPWCREYPGRLLPVYGKRVEAGSPVTTQAIDKDPFTGKAQPGGLEKFYWGKQHFIGHAARLLGSKAHIKGDTTSLAGIWSGVPDWVLDQLTSWHQVRKPSRTTKLVTAQWEPKKSDIDDHLLFCLCYCLVAAYWAGWLWIPRPDTEEEKPADESQAIQAAQAEAEAGNYSNFTSAYDEDVGSDWTSRFTS